MALTLPGPSADLIAAFTEELRIRGKAKRTIEHRRWVLTKMDRELPYGLDQADEREIRDWLYRDDWSTTTKAAYYDSAAPFYAWCTGRYLSLNPMEELPRPHPRAGMPRPVTHAQLERILTEAEEPYDLWALIAAYQGARCVEISNLDRDHIDENMTYLLGKGGKERVVPTHSLVWAAVQELPAGPIAITKRGVRANPHYVSREAGQHFAELFPGARPRVTMHRCRHWYGTYAQRAGRDTRVTQEMLGHASPTTTALYTQVAMEDMRAAVDGLPLVSVRRLGVSAGGSAPAASAA